MSQASHVTIAIILKNNNELMKAVKGFASLKATRQKKKKSRRIYIRYRETSNDNDWRPDTEEYSSHTHDNHGQSKKLVCNDARKS